MASEQLKRFPLEKISNLATNFKIRANLEFAYIYSQAMVTVAMVGWSVCVRSTYLPSGHSVIHLYHLCTSSGHYIYHGNHSTGSHHDTYISVFHCRRVRRLLLIGSNTYIYTTFDPQDLLFISYGILFNHESPRRGSNFVTEKIVKGAINIAIGKQEKLHFPSVGETMEVRFYLHGESEEVTDTTQARKSPAQNSL